MQNPSITILHTLPGRLRMSLTWPPKSVEKFEKDVMGHVGINSVYYNPITKSILIYHNPSEIEASEILIRVALAVSLDYKLMPVEIATKPLSPRLNTLDNYAGVSLLLAWIVRLLKVPLNMQNIFIWNATISTISAILHHAWVESRKHGVYDPEVLSVTYLISAMAKENLLPAATGTWITTFGRHLIESSGENMTLHAFEVYDNEQEVTYYDVAITPKRNMLDGKDIARKLMYSMAKSIGKEKKQIRWMKEMKNVSRDHGDILEGIGKLDNHIFLRLKY